MTTIIIHGEIAADGKNVIIMAAGPMHALKPAQLKLGLITPLISKSDPPGALMMPLSWPACVQMAFTFGQAWRPGPRLSEWLFDQVSARTGYLGKELRYQPAAGAMALGFTLYPWQVDNAKMVAHCSGGLITDDPGLGKALRSDQPILTPTGWTPIGELKINDQVIGSNGLPVNVTGVYPQGIRQLFEVTTSDGITVIADADHLWTTQTSYDRRRNPDRWGTRTTAEIGNTLTVPDGARRRTNHYLPLISAPVEGPVIDLPLDPWLLGVLIGDGGMTTGTLYLSNPDANVLAQVRNTLPNGVALKPVSTNAPNGCDWRISGPNAGGQKNPITEALRELGLWGCYSYEKFIPLPLLHASTKQRYVLLTGLLDTDGGTNEDNTIEYSTSSLMLAKQVRWLVQSLGGVVHTYQKHAPTYTHKGEKRIGRPAWRLNINLPPDYPPFAYSAKVSQYTKGTTARPKRPPIRQIVSVIPVENGHATCISVNAPDKLYITTGGILTHNTLSAIVGLAERELWGRPATPAVVVCPPSVVDSWVRAFELWAPHWRTVAWRGVPDKRREMVGHHDIYVTGYPLARRDAAPGEPLGKSPLAKIKPVSVIVDEIQNINNPDAIQTRAVQRLVKAAKVFVPMSGTPITHNVSGLHPTLEVLERGAFPSCERFTTRYATSVNGDYGTPEIIGLNPYHEPEFRTALLGRMVRHNKAECLPDLPPKVYSIREVTLPPEYKKAYKTMEDQMIAELPDGQEMSVMSVLTQIIRLQQLSSAAADVEIYYELDNETGETKEKQRVTLKHPSWKVDALLEILAERPGQPVVAFAPSRQLIMLAGQSATAAGLQVGYIVGDQKPAERTASIDSFQAGQIDLMCATTQAGGTGLTLTAAGTFVFLQRPYSYVESSQAEDRGHRIGTKHDSIEIIDIYAKGTIDGRIREILHVKAGQTSELLKDPRIVRELLGGENVRRLKAVS